MSNLAGSRLSGPAWVIGWLFLAAAFLPLEISAQPPESPGQLMGVSWEAQLLGRTQAGCACWLNGQDRSQRIEILPGASLHAGLSELLTQEGEGFTLILGTDCSGTFNPWGQKWRKLEGPAAAWVRLVSGLAEGADPAQLVQSSGNRLLSGAVSRRAWRPRFLVLDSSAHGQGAVRIQLPSLADLSSETVSPDDPTRSESRTGFRDQQVVRGRGRGGRQEILTCRPVNQDATGGWELKSSRKPGRILISHPETWQTSPVSPEVFAPLWPLDQLLVLGEKIPGTSPAP